MFRIIKLTAAAIAVAWGTVAGAATLDGLSVDITSVHGSCLGVTVGAGAECSIYDTPSQLDDVLHVDIQSSGIVFEIEDLAGNGGSAWSTAPSIFNVVISGLTGFSITSTALDLLGNTLFGGTLSAALTNPGEVTLSFNNFDVYCSTGACARFTVAGNVSGVPAVPLPAGLPLLFAALGAFGLIRRKSA